MPANHHQICHIHLWWPCQGKVSQGWYEYITVAARKHTTIHMIFIKVVYGLKWWMGQTNTYKLKMSTCLLEAQTLCPSINVRAKWKRDKMEKRIWSNPYKIKTRMRGFTAQDIHQVPNAIDFLPLCWKYTLISEKKFFYCTVIFWRKVNEKHGK